MVTKLISEANLISGNEGFDIDAKVKPETFCAAMIAAFVIFCIPVIKAGQQVRITPPEAKR